MTLRKFMRLYGHYKNDFDFKLTMEKRGLTYAKIKEISMQDDEWL